MAVGSVAPGSPVLPGRDALFGADRRSLVMSTGLSDFAIGRADYLLARDIWELVEDSGRRAQTRADEMGQPLRAPTFSWKNAMATE
jgi:hypothetical protein